jgi:hypothetical protein
VNNPTSNGAAATPAAGSRHVGMPRRIVTSLRGEVICDECGTAFDADQCPTCAQRRGGWWPSRVRPYDDDGQGDDEPDGWPW